MQSAGTGSTDRWFVYLLDTCVLSDLSPDKSKPDAALAGWLRRNGHDCYISAVSLTEIAYGVTRLRHRGATAKAARLAAWQEEVVLLHADRVLPVDLNVAIRAGVLLAVAQAAGFHPGTEDAWIAAKAELNALALLSFNEADFSAMNVPCRNPAANLPPDRGG